MLPSPPYAKTEIERRWLVPAEVELELPATREREIEDRYILETRLRLRKVMESGHEPIYKLGKKYEPHAPGAHHVVSTYLSAAEYEVLAMLPALVSRKRRQSVLGGALDVYLLPNHGLRVFEVEFSSPEAAAAYTPPNGVGKEITNEPTFTGHALAGAA